MNEQSVLYGGTVKLEFSPSHHIYTWEGSKIDGVTSVLRVINKPKLLGWAARCAAEYCAEEFKPGHVYNAEQIAAITEKARSQYNVKRNKAADTGTLVHAWIEDWIKGRQPELPHDHQVLNGVLAFKRYVDSQNIKFVASEQKIFSKKYKYAGTLDFEAEIDGKLFLGDIKTSSGIYPEMFLQTSAYQQAREEENPGRKYAGQLIINCRKDGILDTLVSTDYEKHIKGFLAALVLYRTLNEMGSGQDE